MPGDTLMRDQTMDKDRRKFTSGLIRAIEELEVRRIQRSPQQLADAAWQKLQYDFPLVETAELQALLEAFSSSLVGKTGWPCYLLTHKALDNISSGARGAGSHAPPLTEQEQQVQQVLEEALTQKVLGRSSSGGTAHQQAAQQQQQQQQQQPVNQQQLYQQLAAVLLLQYAAKVASLPDQEAWQLMQAYCPEALQEQPCQHQQQQQVDGTAEGMRDIDALVAAAASGAAAHGSGNSSCHIYDDTEAAEQDGNSEEYEPLEAGALQPQLQHNHTHNPCQQDSRPFSWAALHQKLLALSENVHYSLFSCELLWRQQGADQHLLQLLRLLGVHSHAQELQPLLHAYVAVLVDRLAAAPQDLHLLQQLWEALGLTAGSGAVKQLQDLNSDLNSSKQKQQGLYPEAVLGLSVAAAVWQQLPAGSARRQLWQLMHGHLLPLLESCAEQLAYSSNGGSNNSSGSGACAQGTAFAHMLLLSHVLELLVLGRPGHVDVAKQLTDLGCTRSLVQLYCKWSCEVAAEPLRRALLLACCCSPHTAAWVLAVPTVKQQLLQQQLKLGGPYEAHGALWQLLLHSGNSQPAKAATSSKPTAVHPAAAAGEEAQQQLLALLQLQSGNVQQLQRQVVALQLMVDGQKAAGSRQRLWGEAVLSALRKLAAQLKEEGAASSESKPAAAASKTRLGSDIDSDSDSEQAEGTAVAAQAAEQQQRSADMDMELQHRRSAQLQPTALRLVKELLTQGGGKTD